MRHTPAPTARDLQRSPVDRALSALARRRRGGRRARLMRRIASLCLLIAAGVVAAAGPTPAADGTAVSVAARDLAAGATITPADVRTAVVRAPPDGALRADPAPTGQILAGPVRRGEILTDARILASSGPRPGPGRAAVPVRPDDAGTVDLLRPGMRVAVIGVGPDGTPRTLSDAAVVLWVPTGDAPTVGKHGAGRLVVLSVPDSVADAIAAVAITGSIGIRFA